jgi:uncharacterized sulfatase
MSDNGPEPGAGSSSPLRGSKGMLYEGGTRSPLIAWGPGLINPQRCGEKNHEAVFVSLDLVPTLLHIAGVSQPTGVIFDGEIFADVILGLTVTQERTSPIFWRRPPDRPGPSNAPWPDLALRSENWKFLTQFDGSQPQLYDLKTDPSEKRNLAVEHPEQVKVFQRQLLDWNAAISPE